MNWPIAFFASFTVLVIAALIFFTIIYIKEYKREERAINELLKIREEQKAQDKVMILIQPDILPEKKKTIHAPVLKKKDIN